MDPARHFSSMKRRNSQPRDDETRPAGQSSLDEWTMNRAINDYAVLQDILRVELSATLAGALKAAAVMGLMRLALRFSGISAWQHQLEPAGGRSSIPVQPRASPFALR